MKYFLICAILFSTAAATLAQDEVSAKHAAYYRCTDHIEKDPHKAYEYCVDYLNKYPNDDKRLTDFALKFVTAYRKISQYVRSIPMTYFADRTPEWAVYGPGLQATIPSEESSQAGHSILIKREYGSAEEKLLVKAESVYKNPEKVEPELLKQWRHIAEPYVVLPDGEPKWWTGSVDTILETELVTTAAVLYYYNISQAMRNKAGRLKENSFTFFSSSLKYESSIKKMDVYERGDSSFRNVYVANMTLTWAQICGGECGSGFTRNKIIVMSADGEILKMFIDDPVNRSSWIS